MDNVSNRDRAKELLKHYFGILGVEVNEDGGVEAEVEEIIDSVCEAVELEVKGYVDTRLDRIFNSEDSPVLRKIGDHFYLGIGDVTVNLSNVTDIFWGYPTEPDEPNEHTRNIQITTVSRSGGDVVYILDFYSVEGGALRGLFGYKEKS